MAKRKAKKVATKAQRRKSVRQVLTGQTKDEMTLKQEVLKAVDVVANGFTMHSISPAAGVAALQLMLEAAAREGVSCTVLR